MILVFSNFSVQTVKSLPVHCSDTGNCQPTVERRQRGWWWFKFKWLEAMEKWDHLADTDSQIWSTLEQILPFENGYLGQTFASKMGKDIDWMISALSWHHSTTPNNNNNHHQRGMTKHKTKGTDCVRSTEIENLKRKKLEPETNNLEIEWTYANVHTIESWTWTCRDCKGCFCSRVTGKGRISGIQDRRRLTTTKPQNGACTHALHWPACSPRTKNSCMHMHSPSSREEPQATCPTVFELAKHISYECMYSYTDSAYSRSKLEWIFHHELSTRRRRRRRWLLPVNRIYMILMMVTSLNNNGCYSWAMKRKKFE